MNYESMLYTVCTCICSDGCMGVMGNFTWVCGIYNPCMDTT